MRRILVVMGFAVVCVAPAVRAQQAGVSGGVFSHVDVAATSASVDGADGINVAYHPEARLMEPRVEVPLSAQGNGTGQNSGQSNPQGPSQTTNGQTTRGIVPGAETAGNYTIIHLASKVGLKEAKVEVSEGYIQPTAGHQFTEFTVRAFGLNAVLRAAAIGIINQADNVPPDWGQGWKPFGERVGSAFGREAVDAAALFGTAAIFREDVEFYRCNCVGFFPRLKHAIWSSFSARAGSDGNRVFSPAPIISPYAGAFTSLAWYPERYGPKDALRWGSYDILYGIGENIGREFLNINF